MTQLLFLKEFLVDPRATGSIWPSAPLLAQKMAEAVDAPLNTFVVELGPGTGTITKALLRSIHPQQLILVEKSATLAGVLTRQFPRSHVWNIDALDLQRTIAERLGRIKINSIVSSLPLRNFAPTVRQGLLQQIMAVLGHKGRYIQYTYAIATRARLPGLKLVKREMIWRNLPPAMVSIHQKGM